MHRFLGRQAALLALGFAALSCARAPRPPAVTPAEIPSLQAQALQQPRNAAVRFRLAAALLAAGRCDTAVVVARAGQLLEPDNVLGPMVVGGCQERESRYDEAVATYTEFADRHPTARGVAALRGKAHVALRIAAVQTARQALAREVELTALPPEPATVAVLPVAIAGDTIYRALSRGLAELITSDLAVIRTLRLLERLQLGALLDELQLAQSERVEAATAARVGRLLRAERLVQGLADIPSSRGPVRLSAAVVRGDGVVRPGRDVTGPFKQLLDLEKQLVFDLSAQLGIQPTEAERQQILRQGPKSLAAFLAYSEGLEALDRGDYATAVRRFTAALRADPGFRAAAEARDAAQAAPIVEQAPAGDVVTVVQAVQEVTVAAEPATTSALSSTSVDVAAALGDAFAQQTTGTETTLRQLSPEHLGIVNVDGTSGAIRIVFDLPQPAALRIIYLRAR